MSKNTEKDITKNLSGKYSVGMLTEDQKFLDHAKKLAADSFKFTSQKYFKKGRIKW